MSAKTDGNYRKNFCQSVQKQRREEKGKEKRTKKSFTKKSFTKKGLYSWCFPENFTKFFTAGFLQSAFERLFVTFPEPIRSQCTVSLHPENIRKPYGFLKFSGGKETVH